MEHLSAFSRGGGNMPRRVLDIGQCDMDHGMIRLLLQNHFNAEVVRAHNSTEAFALLREQPFDLALVNRILDCDQSEGLEIIRQMKADPALSSICVMLVTNFSDHEKQAVAAGAEPGFGKAALESEQTRQRLQRVLGSSPTKSTSKTRS